VKKKVQTIKQQKLLVTLGLSFGNLFHLSRRGPTYFESRFLEEFEESLIILVKIAFFCFELPFQIIILARMSISSQLHGSMSHFKKLADFLMLLPICLLASLGTIVAWLCRPWGLF
jgi:hypothetical protein